MPDNGPDLGVHVQTTVDPSGLNQTADGIGKVKEASQGAAPAAQQLSDSTKELTKSKRGLLDQLKLLRHELPEVGTLMHLVRHPVTLIAGVVSMAVAAF